jgi:hypothetical protein
MARVFLDGFEAGDLKLWNLVVGAYLSSGVAGMDGTYCLNCDGFGDYYAHKYLAAASEYYLAFRYRGSSAQYASSMCYFFNGTTQLARLRRNPSSGFLEIRRGTGYGTVLATGAIAVNVGTPVLIEVHYKPHNTEGVFQVKVGGILDIDFTGDTTDGATAIDAIRLGGDSGYYSSCWFDNVVIDNAAWPGNTKIQAIKPTGAGNSTQWTPSAGGNYQCVDEVPPSESDFVSTNTIGHLDLYAAGDLVGTIGSVKCVQVQALAKAEGSPSPHNLQLAVRTNGADYFSDDKAVPSSSTQLSSLWEANPATSAPWQEAEVNAMEIGAKAVA